MVSAQLQHDMAAGSSQGRKICGQARRKRFIRYRLLRQEVQKGRIRNQFEDVCKYEMMDGHIRIMYLIANQTRTDGKMLLRKAGYTGGAYREQDEGKAEKRAKPDDW